MYLAFGIRCLAVGVVAALSIDTGASGQWPQWRGPDGLGISPETDLPLEWSPTKNIAWKTEIPGRGHSSPVIAGGLVFVTAAIKGKEVPGRKAPVHLNFDYTPGYVHPDAVDIEFEEQLSSTRSTRKAAAWRGSASRTTA